MADPNKPKPMKGFLQKRGPKGELDAACPFFAGFAMLRPKAQRGVSPVAAAAARALDVPSDSFFVVGGFFPSSHPAAAHHGWKRRWFVLDENKVRSAFCCDSLPALTCDSRS